MTKKEILESLGYDPNNPQDVEKFYAQYPTEESFQMAMGGMVEEYKKGGWIQKATASIKRRGTEGVCTGSKFGGPTCRPGTRRYALAKTFRKMAKARKKEDGGTVDMYEDYMTGEYGEPEMQYAQGGVVDVYQLMGMPTPAMYGMGGTTNIGDLSHVISAKNFPNMGYAMGGGVNGPNLLPVDTGNMPIFAMGGMTGQPTEINVEKGELLIDPKTNKILTKYLGGGMVPHPKKGIDKRGTVIAKEGDFVIPKKYAPEFVAAKENNNILVLERIKNNTVIEKAQKEAKDAQIAAAEEQKANKAMNRIVAKYGGAIKRMYAKGGMINRYDGGAGVTGPRVAPFFNFPDYQGTYPDQSPYMAEGNESWGPLAGMTNPVTGMANYLNKLSPAQATPMMGRLPLKGNPQPNLTATPEYRYFNNPGSMNIVGDTTDYFDQGNVPGALELMQQQNTMSPSKFNQMARTSGSSNFDFSSQPTKSDRKGFNVNPSTLENIGMYAPAAYNIARGIFEKPEKFNKFVPSGKLESYETPYQTDYGPYNVTKYNLRQLGNAGPAGFTALYNAFASQEAKNRLANRETNLQRKMAADQFNLNRGDQAAQFNFGIDKFNAEQRAARRNMLSEGVGQLGEIAAYNKGLRQDKGILGDLYKNYEFINGKWTLRT